MLLLRAVRRLHPPLQPQCSRTFVEARIKWVRDRGLDHAVEKEKNLRSMLALKDFIKSEPSKHLPISLVAEHKSDLSLPTRAFDFIRNYPSIFQEFLPPGVPAARPHVRLTPDVLRLDEEEQSIYERESYRQDTADRLLRLLMLTRIKKLPLKVIDSLRWDLGLPQDYVRTLVTDFPDYFEITKMKNENSSEDTLALELVCWIDELAVSVREKKAKSESRYRKGMPLAFPLQFSRGFDMEKKVKKWVDEWQKLPYISPYEDASHLNWRSDQAEKWVVAVLHELLHLLISKKTQKESILCLGEYLGLRSRFRRALVNHPGIFYVSNKIRTHTAVLREGYKRDLLLEKHPLMCLRYQYIHLMNKGKEQVESSGALSSSASVQQQSTCSAKQEEEEDGNLERLSGLEADDARDDGYDYNNDDGDDDDDEEEDEDELNGCQSIVVGGEIMPHSRIGLQRSSRTPSQANSNERYFIALENKIPTVSRRRESHKGRDHSLIRSSRRSSYPSSGGRFLAVKKKSPSW